MRYQWHEIRARAAAFAERHAQARYEKGETQTFYNDFFDVFGVDRKHVAVYEQRVKNLPGDKQGFIDLFMPGTLIVEQKSAGLDLRSANNQALNYFDWLAEVERPRYILTCDFQRWHLIDLETRREWRFTLPELKKHVEAFAFIVGVPTRQFRNQKPANPKATKLLSDLHKALADQGYAGHKLQLLLVRLLFILFADDTGIWPKDQFLVLLERRTQADGRDLGRWLTELFDVLDTPADARQAGLDADLAAFPHVNGKLFAERIGTAVFDNLTRDTLLDASAFNWGEVSPAIFGSLFEGVIDKVTRRKQGAHYTPEEAILKVIGPLFLDDLWAEFEAIKIKQDARRPDRLNAFHQKLGKLTFFDPACGAGNFLVVAYRELRVLEHEVIRERYIRSGQHQTRYEIDASRFSIVNVDQFFGIEIDEFPSQIAQVALWMTDHIANTNLAEMFGQFFARIPLVTAPTIHQGDALEIDWSRVLPPDRCSFVFGNPPFIGQSYQSPEQRRQMRSLLSAYGRSAGSLDYVGAWFLKAGEYAKNSEARIAFVATNSICQGENVGQLWPLLFGKYHLEIAFAHRTFAWPGRAAVHCVIIGLDKRGAEPPEKRLFSYADLRGSPVETRPSAIAAYLIAADPQTRQAVVLEARDAISAANAMRMGSKIVDGGHYIFTAEDRQKFLLQEPSAEPYLLPLIGSKEFIQGGQRWILDLQDVPAVELRNLPAIIERVRRVRKFREASKKPATNALAATPLSYEVNTRPKTRFLVVPKVSSERRSYVPMDWVAPPAIPTDLVQTVQDATLYDFGILTSTMHMAWLRHIGGRLKSDYRYSIGLVYNTFPWPEAGPGQRAKIEALAQAVLDTRQLPKNATSTLADLYDPDRMPAELHKAHKALDAAVDRLYAARGFTEDRARVEHLFRLYEKLVHPTAGAPAANRRQNRRVARAVG